MNEEYYKDLFFPSPPQSNGNYIFGLIVGALLLGFLALCCIFIIGLNFDAFLHIFEITFFLNESSITLIISSCIVILEVIYGYYARIWFKRRDVEHEQQLYESWSGERLELYSQLKGKMSELHLEQISYIDQMANQYKKKGGNMNRFSMILFVLFSMILFPLLILIPFTTPVEDILIMLILFIFCFGVGYSTIIIEPVINKIFSISDPYRHMKRAMKTANLNLLIIEVKRFEDAQLNRVSGEKSIDLTLFWFFKTQLFLLNGDLFYASQILTNLRKKIKQPLIFRGEVDLLLGLNYVNSDKENQALELLQEAGMIFTKNNIQEHSSIINETILIIKSKNAI